VKKLFLGLLLAATMLLGGALPANAAEYETFVGCNDLEEEPLPSHVCHIGDFPAAYFASDVDVEYEVCVEFPTASVACAEENFAEAGFLYVNSITSEVEGNHLVIWYVEGVEVGSWVFRMDPAPPPPPPPLPPPPSPAPTASPIPPVVTPVTTTPSPQPSATCRRAKQQVTKLTRRLRNTTGHRQKVRIRVQLGKARSAVRRAC
jgi:hypothetical protein